MPLFDPQVIADGGYLRRSNTVTLGSSSAAGNGGRGTGGALGTSTTSGPLDFTALNVSYLQGFSTGLQLEAIGNNAASVEYGSASQRDPFSTPSTSVTLTQPLLRGFGRRSESAVSEDCADG